MCHALDEAKLLCHSKEAFVDFMKCKGFEVTRYTDRHITFQKVGEEKKIRANTLAKQFGDYYTKENLERMMGYYSIPKPLPPREQPPPQKPFVSEFEKYEKVYIKENLPTINLVEAAVLRMLVMNSTNPLFYLLLVIAKIMFHRKNRSHLDHRYFTLHQKLKPQKQYKTKKPDLQEIKKRFDNQPKEAGNILYGNLARSQGANFHIKLDLTAVPKMYACPIFFSMMIFSDHAIVMIKEKDKFLLQQALGVNDINLLEKHNRIFSPKFEYLELKNRAEYLGVKLEYMVIELQELEKLKNEKDRFVVLKANEGKLKLAFLPQNKDYILHCLYPDKHQAESDDLFSVTRNSKVNTRLKSEALLNGKQMRYRTLTRVEVEELHKQTSGQEIFAVFSKSENGQKERYNVAFKKDDEQKIDTILSSTNKPKFRR